MIQVIWGSGWDALLAMDVEGALRTRMEACVVGDYQRYSILEGDAQREHWVAGDPELERMMNSLTDEELKHIKRGGQDPKKIYAAFNYPGVVAHVGSISMDDGGIDRIIDIKEPVIYSVTSMAYDHESKRIFYTTDNHSHRDLRVIDPETGKSKMLLKDARIGDLAFNPADRSVWGVRHFNGFATLVRIPHPYDQWEQIHSWPYGEVIYDVDISADGTLLSASLGKINGRQSLNVWQIESLLDGDEIPVETVEFDTTIPSNFVFSPDGRYLLIDRLEGTAASDIWYLDMEERAEPIAWLATPADEYQARFSPDSRWIAYASDETGQLEVYVRPFPGPGGRWQISSGGGSEPYWSSDGREIFFRNQGFIHRVVVDSSDSFSAGRAEPLVEGGVDPPYDHTFSPAVDGQRFLILRIAVVGELAPVQIVLDWGIEVERLTTSSNSNR